MSRTPEWPADKVERRAVAELVPYARNARTHSDEQIAQIAASIREWGWTVPVLVDEAGGIIAGHGRVLAAKKIGVEDVPVMVARGWSEAQRRAYVIADNRLTENGGWDESILGFELGELQGLDFDLGLLGFDTDALAGLLNRPTEGLTDPDDVPEPPEDPVTAPGDTWLLGRHRLRCGDSTSAEDVAALLDGAEPQLMATDPPYGVNYDPAWRNRTGGSTTRRTGKVANDDRADWREAWALFPGDVAYVWHGALHAAEVAESLAAEGFEIRAEIIWAKDRLVLGRGHYHWQHEPCFYAVRSGGKGRWRGDRKQSTLWTIPNRGEDAATTHGTQKPVECMRRPIVNNSAPGQAVYEPFSGSGTTIVAGEMEGRAILAMELDPAWCDVAVQRWRDFTGAKATLEATGETYGRRAKRRKAA